MGEPHSGQYPPTGASCSSPRLPRPMPRMPGKNRNMAKNGNPK